MQSVLKFSGKSTVWSDVCKQAKKEKQINPDNAEAMAKRIKEQEQAPAPENERFRSLFMSTMITCY